MKPISYYLRVLDRNLRSTTSYIARIRYEAQKWRFQSAGKNGSLGKRLQILGTLNIEIGHQVAIRDDVILGGHGTLIIGDNSSLNAECIIGAMERIEIGRDVMIAPRVYILDVDHQFDNRAIPMRKQGYNVSPVSIGNDVWVGTGAVITRGVKIGEGAIIAANAVVTRDVEPFTIVGGIPARQIGQR